MNLTISNIKSIFRSLGYMNPGKTTKLFFIDYCKFIQVCHVNFVVYRHDLFSYDFSFIVLFLKGKTSAYPSKYH